LFKLPLTKMALVETGIWVKRKPPEGEALAGYFTFYYYSPLKNSTKCPHMTLIIHFYIIRILLYIFIILYECNNIPLFNMEYPLYYVYI
jgi:hypothetical protein